MVVLDWQGITSIVTLGLGGTVNRTTISDNKKKVERYACSDIVGWATERASGP